MAHPRDPAFTSELHADVDGSDDEPRQSCYLAWAAKPQK
jgi:hypothetical protein